MVEVDHTDRPEEGPMAFTDIDLARAVQADRERYLAQLLSHAPPRHGLLPSPGRRRRDRRPRLRWSWRQPRPVFPVGYGR